MPHRGGATPQVIRARANWAGCGHSGGAGRRGPPAGWGPPGPPPPGTAAPPPGGGTGVRRGPRRPGGRPPKWYSAGVGPADGSPVARHSVKDQGDGDATMATDTLVI